MTHQEAEELQQKYLYLKGQSFTDPKKRQTDTITDLIIAPQDHPFFPEFLTFYIGSGSYIVAAEKSFQKHQDEIIYSVKCVLDEVYDLRNDVEMHVLSDLDHVIKHLP